MKVFECLVKHPPKFIIWDIRGIALEDFHIIEQFANVNSLIYDNEVSDGGFTNLLKVFLRRFISAANFLRQNNQICHVRDVNNFFKSIRFPTCETFSTVSSNSQRHLTK